METPCGGVGVATPPPGAIFGRFSREHCQERGGDAGGPVGHVQWVLDVGRCPPIGHSGIGPWQFTPSCPHRLSLSFPQQGRLVTQRKKNHKQAMETVPCWMLAGMMMNPKVILVMAITSLSGCQDSTNAPPISRADRSEACPIAERYHSVTNLLRPGMSMAEARALLGDGMRVRRHGPRTDLSTGTTTNYEEWVWVIDASHGQIIVHSTTGTESDLEQGVVASVSYAKKYPTNLK